MPFWRGLWTLETGVLHNTIRLGIGEELYVCKIPLKIPFPSLKLASVAFPDNLDN